MTRDQLLAELRQVIDDEIPDYGWTDTTLLGYLAEGQDRFCEETGFFVDFQTYTLETEEGVDLYEIPDKDRVIQVMSAYRDRVRLGKLVADPIRDDAPFEFPAIDGAPTNWRTDTETGAIQLWPIPDGVYTVNLRVWRRSKLALDATDAEPEIPPRFQRACIEWAAYKAFMHHDMEQQDKVKAGDHLAAFGMYVRDGKRAAGRALDEPIGFFGTTTSSGW